MTQFTQMLVSYYGNLFTVYRFLQYTGTQSLKVGIWRRDRTWEHSKKCWTQSTAYRYCTVLEPEQVQWLLWIGLIFFQP